MSKEQNTENKDKALHIGGVMRSFSLEEVKKIANDIMNLGMELRQNQLNGYDARSGNEVMKEYFDKISIKPNGKGYRDGFLRI